MDKVGTIITQVDTSQRHRLGYRKVVGNNTYRYWKNAGATTTVVGGGVYFSGATGTSVTITGTSAAARNCPAGIAISAVAQDEFGWFLTRGTNTALGLGAVTLGQAIIGASNSTGRFAYTTNGVAPISKPFGRALTSVGAGSLFTGFIDLE